MKDTRQVLGTVITTLLVIAATESPAVAQQDIAGALKKAAEDQPKPLALLAGAEADFRQRTAEIKRLRTLAKLSGDTERIAAIDELSKQHELLDMLKFDGLREKLGDKVYEEAIRRLQLGGDRQESLSTESLNKFKEAFSTAPDSELAVTDASEKLRGLADQGKESAEEPAIQDTDEDARRAIQAKAEDERAKLRDIGEEARAKAEPSDEKHEQEVQEAQRKGEARLGEAKALAKQAEAKAEELVSAKIPTQQEADATAAKNITESNADEVFQRLRDQIKKEVSDLASAEREE